MCCYVFSMRECLFPNEVQSKYMNSWAKTTSRYIAHRRFVLVVKWWCYCNIISFTNECMWKGAAWRFAKKLHVQTLTRSGRPHVCSHTRSLQIQTTPTTTTGKKTAKYVCAWESRWHIYCVHVVPCIIVGYRQPVVVVQPATVVWWKIPQFLLVCMHRSTLMGCLKHPHHTQTYEQQNTWNEMEILFARGFVSPHW